MCVDAQQRNIGSSGDTDMDYVFKRLAESIAHHTNATVVTVVSDAVKGEVTAFKTGGTSSHLIFLTVCYVYLRESDIDSTYFCFCFC